jgi:AAA15 family ATPase/GTPase
MSVHSGALHFESGDDLRVQGDTLSLPDSFHMQDKTLRERPKGTLEAGIIWREWGCAVIETTINNLAYIPEKDILEHAKGLLPFIEQKPTGFDEIYREVLVNAQDIPTKQQTEIQKEVGKMIADIIGGHIEWVQSEGSFYTVRSDGMRIPFASEASGFKKLGYLGLLVTSGQLEKRAVLFWDEPENSLNPKLMPKLAEILLKLSQNGVQVFIATHSDFLCKWFELKTSNSGEAEVKFFSLYEENTGINSKASQTYRSLERNSIIEQSVELYKEHLWRATERDEN